MPKAFAGLPKRARSAIRDPFLRPQFARAERYPSRIGLILRSLLGVLVASGLLVGLAYLLGHGPIGPAKGFLWSVSSAIRGKVAAGTIAFAAVLLGGSCVRRLWLEYLASRQVKIQVADFQCSPGMERDAANLTTQFRNRLATLSLRSDSLAPGAPPANDFLNVLSSAPSGNSVTQALGFVRATFPSTALLIGGNLLENKASLAQRYGVSLQVTRMPDQGSVLEHVWDSTWEMAVARAADAASAAILPRTRLCRGPWVTWRGYVMPAELLSSYERSLELGLEKRYEEALELCYRALALDPLNRAVRLQLGKLMEQHKRFLDALGVYEAIVTAARPDEGKLPRNLYGRRARLERARMEHIARYRLIVLLGGGAIADEWQGLDKAMQADVLEILVRICVEPRRVRREFWLTRERPILAGCRHDLAIAKASHPWATRDARGKRRKAIESARTQLVVSLESARLAQLKEIRGRLLGGDRLLLPSAGRALADDLRRDLRIWRMKHPWGRSHLLTATVALAGACIEVRSEILNNEFPRVGRMPAGVEDTRGLQMRGWIDTMLKECEHWTGLRTYQNHYNAACMYAIPFNEMPGLDKNSQELLADRAVKHLTLAASFADSAYLAGRQEWLLKEDPDLTGLRKTPQFARFESMYFPHRGNLTRGPADDRGKVRK